MRLKLCLGFLVAAAVLVIAALVSPARADNVILPSTAATRQSTSDPFLVIQATIDETDVTCFLESTGAEPMLIPWDAQAVVTCDSEGVLFFWTQADNGSMTINKTTLIVDDTATTGAPGGAAPNGRVPGFEYRGGYRSSLNARRMFESRGGGVSVGRRINVCSSEGRPCAVDADCLGADTCSTSGLAFNSITGAYLCGVALGASPVACRVTLE